MLNTVFKHGSGYFLVSIFSKSTSLLLLPVITQHLSIEEYGLYANLQATQIGLYLLATFSFDAAYGRFIYDYNSSTKKLRILTSTIFTLYLLWVSIYLIISAVSVNYLLNSWGTKEIILAITLPFLSVFQQFIALNTSLMQSRLQTRRLLTISTSAFFASQGIMILMLIGYDMGVKSFFFAQFLVNATVAIIHINMMRKERLIKLFLFSKITFKKLYRYALGYIPASLSGWIFTVSDRYIITYYVSLAMTGKYSFIMQLAMTIQILMHALDTAYSPLFMRIMKSKKGYKKITDYFSVMILALVSIYLCFTLFLPPLIDLLFPEKYHGDYLLIPILSMGFVFLSFRKIFANFLIYYKKSFWISVSGYIPAIMNILLNIILIPHYGIYAAAWTSLISLFLYFMIVFIMAKKLHSIKVIYYKLTILIVLTLVASYIGLSINTIESSFLLIMLFVVLVHFSKINHLIKCLK